MKIFTLSNRFYYQDLSIEDAQAIKDDLTLYNQMLHYAYKKLYEVQFYHVKEKIPLQKQLKVKYGTNDYFPLSVINEAKALLKSNIQTNQRLQKQAKKRIQKIKAKMRQSEEKIAYYEKEKERLIQLCKQMEYAEKDYLYEVQVVDPNRKQWKNQRSMLLFRLHREEYRLKGLKKKVKACCFGGRKQLQNSLSQYRYARRKRMLIPGRRQGKYSNNLFKYHIEEGIIVYRSTQKDIELPIVFHHHKKALERAVKLPHNTAGKAVAYELYDYGEYFIIKAIVEYQETAITTTKEHGTIGIDINVEHIALTQINKEGNLIDARKYAMSLKGKTTKQREHIQYNIIRDIMMQCKASGKSLVIEELNFENKKDKQLYENKRSNEMLSSFAYAKIVEKIERKACYEGVEVIKVDPAYTSQVGKLKYMKQKGISIHQAASYVIARKGKGYQEKVSFMYKILVDKKKKKMTKWQEISKVFKKASIQECYKNPYMHLI